MEKGSEELSEFERTALDWRAADAVHGSAGGSGGVFFASWPGGQRVVVKGSGEPAREVFATRVLRALGVATPACRTLQYGDAEYEQLKLRLLALSSGELQHRVAKCLNRSTLLVFEFVEGRSALEVPPDAPEWAAASLAPRLGALLAADLALNNLDRLPWPALWDNEGNLGNLMLRPDGVPVAIDSSCFCIRAQVSGCENALLGRHLGRLAAALGDLAACRGAGRESGAVRSLRERLAASSGVSLDAAQGAALQEGLCAGLERLARLPPAWWDAQRAAVAALVPPERDWERVWERDLALVDPAFLAAVRALVADHF